MRGCLGYAYNGLHNFSPLANMSMPQKSIGSTDEEFGHLQNAPSRVHFSSLQRATDKMSVTALSRTF